MEGLLILVVIIAGGYLLLRKTPVAIAVDKLAADIIAANPDMDMEQAKAQAAALIAAAAADAAARAEEEARVKEAAEAARLAEIEAAKAQALAILRAEEEAARLAAIKAEEAAKKARAELEARWKTALANAEIEMAKAKDAAVIAMDVYDKQLAVLATPAPVVCYYHANYGGRLSIFNTTETGESKDLRNAPGPEVAAIGGTPGVGVGNDDMSSVKVKKGFIARLYGHIYYGGSYLEVDHDISDLSPLGWNDTVSSVRVFDTPARTVLGNIRTEAVAAMTAARLTTERVLTITADVRLLGILLATADRLDSIARATTDKIAAMQAKL